MHKLHQIRLFAVGFLIFGICFSYATKAKAALFTEGNPASATLTFKFTDKHPAHHNSPPDPFIAEENFHFPKASNPQTHPTKTPFIPLPSPHALHSGLSPPQLFV